MADYAGKEFLDQATQSLQGGRYQQALEFADNAISLAPENAEAYLLRGIAQSQLNRPHDAVESLRKAMELDPANPKPPYNLAVHYYGAGEKREALTAVEKAIDLDPAHPAARDLLQRLQSELNIVAPAHPAPAGAVTAAEPPLTPASPMPVQDAGQWRQGYLAPVHSIRWIENIEGAWDVIGWLLAGILLVISIFLVATIGLDSFRTVGDLTSNSNGAGMPASWHTPLSTALIYLWLALALESLTWMICELADRRGPWLWMLPFVLCCCCGMQSITMILYLLLGRSKRQIGAL